MQTFSFLQAKKLSGGLRDFKINVSVPSKSKQQQNISF